MEYSKFTKRYIVKKLNEINLDEIEKVYAGNPDYFKYVPPLYTKESILRDLKALPYHKDSQDKYFLGYYSDHLVAVMDLIDHYPDLNSVMIGLFMVNSLDQGKYIGWNMIQDLCRYLKTQGYQEIRLGYVKENIPAKYFWEKCGFIETGLISHQELYDLIILKKDL